MHADSTRAGRDLVVLPRGVVQSQACFHQRIREELGPDTPVLAPGAFNDEPFDESLRLFAEASRERGLVERSRTTPRFTNLAWRFSPTEATDRLGQKRRIYGTVSFNDCGLAWSSINPWSPRDGC